MIDCPANPRPAPVVPPPAAAAAAAAAAPPIAAPRLPHAHDDEEDDEDWSESMLRQLPPPFSQADLIEAVGQARLPNMTEIRLEEGRTSTTARVLDHFTDKVFSKQHWSVPKETFDSLPKRLMASASKRVAVSTALLLSLASAVAASPALREALDNVEVDLSTRIPGSIIDFPPRPPPVAPALALAPRVHPSGLHVIQAVLSLVFEIDGILLEASHLPNALRASEVSGLSVLQGTAQDIKNVVSTPALARMYDLRLDKDEATEPIVRCRPMTDTFLRSSQARLSLLYRTPITWQKRKVLLRHHWRIYWHRYTKFMDDATKNQASLQTALNVYRSQQEHLQILRSGVDRDRAAGRKGTPDLVPGMEPADPPVGGGKRTGSKGGRGHDKAAKKTKLDPNASAFSLTTTTTPTPTGGALVVPTPQALTSGSLSLPTCRIDNCPACKATKGNPHLATCSWVAGVRARGGSF